MSELQIHRANYGMIILIVFRKLSVVLSRRVMLKKLTLSK